MKINDDCTEMLNSLSSNKFVRLKITNLGEWNYLKKGG